MVNLEVLIIFVPNENLCLNLIRLLTSFSDMNKKSVEGYVVVVVVVVDGVGAPVLVKGVIVGSRVGSMDGSKDGSVVGSSVGSSEGSSVGSNKGSSVGSNVGETVTGAFEGTELVGAFVDVEGAGGEVVVVLNMKQ